MDVEDPHRLALEIVGRGLGQPCPDADRDQQDARPEQGRRQRTCQLQEAGGIGKGVKAGHWLKRLEGVGVLLNWLSRFVRRDGLSLAIYPAFPLGVKLNRHVTVIY
ncbi:hypothetical protein GCM10009087_08000 [Sphingomonas oligophenolica]